MGKKLYRSRENKTISGVCGGIAEYFAIDPTIVRIILVLLSLLTDLAGIPAYIVAVLIIPERPLNSFDSGYSQKSSDEGGEYFDQNKGDWKDYKEPTKLHHSKNGILIGVILIILGVMFFIKQFVHWIDVKYIIPAILIGIGAIIIFRGSKR